jgi:Ca2+-binding RTX toxin-like protein
LVKSSATYTLSAHVENLELTGSAAINGTGNSTANTITGNSAANTINGGSGIDTMKGAGGDDIYIVDNTADVIEELTEQGNDLVQSTATYTLSAHVENLELTGSAAINGTGNSTANTITGNSGVNTLTGGNGNDTYIVQNTNDVIVELSDEGTDLVKSSATYTLSAHVENLELTGTAAINGTGNSTANTITGNSGVNTLTGGNGDDTYIVQNTNDVIVELSDEGTDLVKSSATYTLSAHVENLELTGTDAINGTGNSTANTITGNSAANIIDGGQGIDNMIGGAGNDTYILDNLDDVITEVSGKTINGTDTIQIKGISTFNLSALKATNIETLDLKSDTAANTMLISSAAIQKIVGTGDGSVLNLKINTNNDVITIQSESGISSVTTSSSINFYASSDTNTPLAQINFIS